MRSALARRVVAALALATLASASCGGGRGEIPPREVPALERPGFDVRRMSAGGSGPSVRIDDLFDSLEWEGSKAEAGPAQRRGWDFESSEEGWTVQNGGRPRIESGRLVVSAGRRTALVSQPGLGIRFRTIRAIEIRMSVSRGKRLTLAWSPGEEFGERKLSVQADLVPGPEPRLYTVKASSLTGYEGLTLGRLRLVPTDAEDADVAIDFIRLVPREGLFEGLGRGLAREEIANESRHVIFQRAPGSFTARVAVPAGGVLELGAGVLDAEPGVVFRVSVEGDGPRQTLIERSVVQDEAWEDVRADLSAWAGRTVRLRFSAESARQGSVALWSSPTVAPAVAPPAAPPNVIVYLVDTLRADHVGAYGARIATTPAIDALAREGALFERCSSQAPWTRPSVASLLTSLYPPEHGVVDQGQRVSDGVITLAEQFRRYGYLTAGFSASTHPGSSSNLTQGFDKFLEPPAVLGSATYVLERHTRSDYTRQTGEAINRRLLPWLERNAARSFFVYVHSTDPHGPYAPGPPYDRMFDSGYRGSIDGTYDPKTGFGNARTAEEIAHVVSQYDGDIRCNDDAIGEMTRTLQRLGLLDRTIVVVTSDHGEEFLEHGQFQHGQSLYQELVRVPLVVRLPRPSASGQGAGGLRIREPVEMVDVFPTLCALAGIVTPPDVRGVSRAELLRGSASGRGGARGGPALSFSWRQGRRSEEVAVSDGTYKLIHRPALGDLLFNLETDPGEKRDLLASEPPRAEALRAAIETWWSGRRRIVSSLDSGKVVIDQEERQWLEALGYVK